MADIDFYTIPMSRGAIVRWALHEVGADYQHHFVDPAKGPGADLLALNPMGKVPTIVHHAADGDHVVTEAAAICTYLAEIYPDAGLAPTDAERADYYRWMYFAAGPFEAAIMAINTGFVAEEAQQQSLGYGSVDRVISALDGLLSGRDYVCGDRFTMADVYLCSHISFTSMAGMLPATDAMKAYVERCEARPAKQAGQAIDFAEFEKQQAAQPG